MLGCGHVMRRLVGRAIMKAQALECMQAVGKNQYGLAQDGAGAVHRGITAHVAMNPGSVVLSMDIADAFSTIQRDAVMSACSRHAPELYSLVHTWIDGSANHVAQGGAGEDACTVEQHVGLDLGCPLSPALYGIAVRMPWKA